MHYLYMLFFYAYVIRALFEMSWGVKMRPGMLFDMFAAAGAFGALTWA